jgi:hypothetical protein
MKDLFGTEHPDPPPMTAPLPWRVYCMDDYEWWVAKSLDEAKVAYAKDRMSDAEAAEYIEDAHELSDEAMDSLKFTDTDEHDEPTVTRTFREELARRIEHGLSAPELFACTET